MGSFDPAESAKSLKSKSDDTEKSYIQRQREKRAAFEKRKDESGRTRAEQRAFDRSNSPEAIQARRDRATRKNAENLRKSGLSSEQVANITGVGQEVTVKQPERDAQGRTQLDRQIEKNKQQSQVRENIIRSLEQSRRRIEQSQQARSSTLSRPDQFGARVIEPSRSRDLRIARTQQSQDLTPLGQLFASTNLARKATPEEVVSGKGVTEGQIVTKLVATGALSDATTPVVRVGSSALKTITPASYRGVSQTSKAAKGTKTFTLREFKGVASDVKGVKKPASVLEIKVDQSGLVFREEKVGRKTVKSVFTERDLFVVEKPARSGRTIRAGVREETDILSNELRSVRFDETLINPSRGSVRTGGAASTVAEKRVTSSLGASRRGSVLARPQPPKKPDLGGLKFTPDSPQFVRPPSVRPQVDSPAFIDRSAAVGNLITGVVRGFPTETQPPVSTFKVGSASVRRTEPRDVRLPADTIQPFQIRELPTQRPAFTPVQRSGSATGQRQNPRQQPVQRTPPALQIPRPKLDTPTRQRPRTPFPNPGQLRPPEPFLQRFNFAPRLGEQKRTQGFRALVKTGGQFRPVGPVLSKREALEFGAKRVGGSPAASFKIAAAGRAPETSLGLSGFFKGFKRSKKDDDVFVEPSKLRINTPGELRGITFKGIKASRFKSVF